MNVLIRVSNGSASRKETQACRNARNIACFLVCAFEHARQARQLVVIEIIGFDSHGKQALLPVLDERKRSIAILTLRGCIMKDYYAPILLGAEIRTNGH